MSRFSRFFRTDTINIYQYVFYGFVIALFWGAILFSSRIDLISQNRIISDLFIGLIGIILTSVLLENIWQLKKLYNEKHKEQDISRWQLAAVEHAGDGVGFINAKGHLIYLNKAFRDMYDLSEDHSNDYLEHDWKSFFKEKIARDTEDLFSIVEEEGAWRGELPVVGTDKETIMDISLIRLPDSGMIVTAKDVSERKEAAEEKAELQWLLFQSQKMEAIGRLAGGIAHDFNNNLASIMGYARFLFEDLSEGSEEQKFAESIIKAGQQSQKLIERILAFSRPDQVVNHEQTDLSMALKDTLSMAESSISGGIEVSKDIEKTSYPVKVSQSYLSQLFMNFFVNAKDAMEDGHGALTVSLKRMGVDWEDLVPKAFQKKNMPKTPERLKITTEQEENEKTTLYLGYLFEGQDYACIEIKDTGSGMKREVLEQIFDPFYTTKDVGKGTGLGLSTVHGILSNMSAALKVESEPGKGTLFELFIPLEKEEDDIWAVDFKEKDDSFMHGTGYVLVVDDDEEVENMVVMALKRMGYTVDGCSSPFEAIDLLREHYNEYDLLITDQMMPKMTGLELSETVAEDFPDLPVVIMSGYSDEQIEEQIKGMPSINAFLKKPLDIKRLSEIVFNLVCIKGKNKAEGQEKGSAIANVIDFRATMQK